ncbi:MAG: hypothetical protein AAF466_15020 [Bacteroidota bacterium]
MKTALYTLLLVLFANFQLWSQEINFPDDYFGMYSGPLDIIGKSGTQTIDMEFHLQPTDSVGNYQYKLVYIMNGDRQERDYTLVEKNKATGTYIVDENNGIILDDKVVGNRMYSLFEVNGTLLTTFITFEKDHMVFEIVTSRTKDQRVTYPDSDPNTEVISYPVGAIQRAVLQKQ